MRPSAPLLSSLLLLLCTAGCAQPEPAAAPRPAMVVHPAPAGEGVDAFAGEVHAREETPLAFRIGGKIARRMVDAGARVRRGQALAELDASDVQLQSDANRAQLASAEADLTLARAELQRYKDLADRQLVSRSLYDTQVARFQAATAQVRQARAQASGAGNQAGYAVLRAPADGVIAQRLAEAGQVVAAGQAVFQLAVDGGREVAISIPEKDLARFPVGRALVVSLWTRPDARYPATLREISPAADALTRTYAARVAITAPDADIALGQSARVYAADGEAAGLSLPLSALTSVGSAPAVWIRDANGAVHRRKVVVGAYGDARVPVREGVRADEWVVAAGVHLLREGEVVVPIDRDNRPVRLVAAGARARPSTTTH
jgi:multidrug efflux system membrane fusion protein